MNASSSHFWRLTDMLDCTTRDIRGEPVGRIVDLIIDPAESRIAYVNILMQRRGTTPGRHITIPWSAISRISESSNDVWVAARKDTLLRLGSGRNTH